MKKRYKLIILGVLTFAVVLLLIWNPLTFFQRAEPTKARNMPVLDKEILLEGNKFNITSIEIKQTTLLNIKVINKDNKGHRVLLLGKEDGKDFQLVDEYLIQQNNAAEMSLVVSPTAEPIGSKHYKEMMLSCTTCVGSGLNSQVKITSTE